MSVSFAIMVDLAMRIHPNLDDYRFDMAAASALSHAPVKTIRNWLDRSVMVAGRRRWMGTLEFSMIDVFRLAMVQLLASNCAITLAEAVSIADALVPCVRGRAMPGDILLLARSEDGASWLAGWADFPADHPPGLRTRPHFLIHVGALVDDLHTRADERDALRDGGRSAGDREANGLTLLDGPEGRRPSVSSKPALPPTSTPKKEPNR